MADPNEADKSGDGIQSGRIDVSTLRTIAQRSRTHPLVEEWKFDPSSVSPRQLKVFLRTSAYPAEVTAARLDIRWFVTNDYSVHYLETQRDEDEPYQCRWDCHAKTTAPRTHFHPPPDAGDAEPSSFEPQHLEVLFTVLDWVAERVDDLH